MSIAKGLGGFEMYLTLWVTAAIVTGIAIGKWLPAIRRYWENCNTVVYRFP